MGRGRAGVPWVVIQRKQIHISDIHSRMETSGLRLSDHFGIWEFSTLEHPNERFYSCDLNSISSPRPAGLDKKLSSGMNTTRSGFTAFG